MDGHYVKNLGAYCRSPDVPKLWIVFKNLAEGYGRTVTKMMSASYKNKELIDMRCRHLWSVKSRKKNEKIPGYILERFNGIIS